ncbi:VWA domain-containing protein [Ruegeria sp. 2205SS24-7]|uniref:VWA domain-containing protein n=1 Tax=Ruegeria discodermiae TaxID=3064389 RepID=UPI002740DC12|nr:VWA domain-containing protein [Ruegeria sp. 2205SS24-7]MDP5218459.1 VWA domain-containing protein [Ruegeria sp. 2205SS24-7]
MTGFVDAFHFLRPIWLLLLPGIGLLWYLARPRRKPDGPDTLHIAPHLAEALRVGSNARRRVQPIDSVVLCLSLLTLAAAGPSWSRIPNPLIAESAPLVVALKVTPSMQDTDLAPSRLDRARFKILDLIAARAGARTALVAYAGTAHRVAPLTEDPDILRPLLQALSPEVMPVEGDDAAAALALSMDILGAAETAGAILFVLDDLDPAMVAAFTNDDPARPPVAMLVTVPAGQIPAQIAGLAGVSTVGLSADDWDIAQIERQLISAQQMAQLDDERLDWDDRGWWLLWPAALIALLWFRQGWTMRWGVAIIVITALQMPIGARADGWRDWFLTPDQQGQLAYRNKDFARAADLFTDPMWKGHALLRAGRYEEAAEVFARLDSAEAAFSEGLARIGNRDYRPGARAFESALDRQPDFPAAAKNAEIAWAIVEQVESTREQSDTGEESGIGADDMAFDNEAQRGAATQVDAPMDQASALSPDQWIDSIDTEMGDFLRSRFLYDNVGGGT